MAAPDRDGGVTAAPIDARERVAVLDVLRGFALFGILVVNMLAFRGTVFGDAGDAGDAGLLARP